MSGAHLEEEEKARLLEDGFTEAEIAAHFSSSRRGARRVSPDEVRVNDYHTVEQAARRLQLSPNALRLRIRRRARRDGRRVAAHLGGGIVAVQLGRSWRETFPS